MSPLPKPQDLFSLRGQTALVTGAGSGIGAAIATCLAGAGAHVICLGRDLAKLESRAAAIRECGANADAFSLDVSIEADVEVAFQEIAKRWGRLSVLVNNAAVMAKHDFLTMTAAEWDALQATNTRGAFLCTREAVRLMRAEGGSIVNIASVAAVHASVFGNAQYGASKAGLLALTRSVAVEFASAGIRCNAILPGAVATEGGRQAAKAAYPIGAPNDVAAAALYLASSAASYVTGQTLIVDGGLMIS